MYIKNYLSPRRTLIIIEIQYFKNINDKIDAYTFVQIPILEIYKIKIRLTVTYFNVCCGPRQATNIGCSENENRDILNLLRSNSILIATDNPLYHSS